MKTKNILNPANKVKLYVTMKKIRLFEKEVEHLISGGLVFGSTHFYIGQEAIAAGILFWLDKKDYVMSTHRGHGHMLAKGADMKKMLAELMGKETGYCKGKGGSMHLAAPEVGLMGANGIVGAGIPISVGLGYACRNFQKERLVVDFFGDGAINTGAFHESLNLASTWGLPILFVCENNQYAISTGIKKATNIKDLSLRARAYGIRGAKVDGNDLVEVLNTARSCFDHIRQKKEPVLLVCETYRQKGHSIHDPRTYRSKAEEDFWINRDPIKKYENLLLREFILDREKISTIEEDINIEIKEAVEFAKASKKVPEAELFQDIFA